MSFGEALCKLDQVISRQNNYFGYFTDDVAHHNCAEERLELFSGRESQDIYCWLGKFQNQFKGCDCKLDSACLAANLACHLTGLAETFYFSLEPETRKNFDLLSKALKERFFSDDLKWRLRQSLISRQRGLHESLDSYIKFIASTCRRLGVSKEDQFYYFINRLCTKNKREVLVRQPKDYLTAVNLARSKELVDRTITDSQPNWNNCKENPVYTLLRDKLRQDLTGEIKSLRDGFPPNFANRDKNSHTSAQPYRRRYTGGFTSQDPTCYRCGVVGHKARVCPNQSHDYYTSKPRRKTSYRNTSLRIVENHVDPTCSTKFNKRSPFVLKNEVPLYRESKLQIPTKTIEYIEVNEHSLLTKIVNDFDEDIDPNSPFETCFEVFTHPKSLDSPEITLTEKKILQAQEVLFIEISVDQYQVCELEYVSAVQVFDPFTIKVSSTE